MALSAITATVVALAASTVARLRTRASEAASDAARMVGLLFAALIFLFVAILAFSIASFYALLAVVTPPWSACIVGAFWTLLALICLLVASRKPRRKELPPAVPPIAPELAAIEIARSLGAEARRATPAVAIVALIAGIIAGRK